MAETVFINLWISASFLHKREEIYQNQQLHQPQGLNITDGEPNDQVDQNDRHEDHEYQEDQFCQPGYIFEVPKLNFSKEHHHYLDEGVPKIVKWWLCE